MAREVLDHGVVLPAEYSDDWYEDMTSNLQKLDNVIGSDGDKLSAGDVATVAISGDYDDLTNKPELKPVATSGDYDDLTDKPSYGILRMTSETLSDSGSGAISNLNSDSKLAAGDYVLDAALKVFPIAAVSAPNYTVGTSLFQITNASALAAVATSGSYDDLNNLPAYGITRFVNAAISDNSNVAFSNISSVDKIKAGDFLLDNAGKMYLIASVDTVNETAAVTTPLTQLAVDANVMHLSGNETVAGIKTFSDDTFIKTLNHTEEVASQSSSGGSIMALINTITYGDSSPSVQARLNFRITADGTKSFYPHENNQYSLGLISRRLKEIHAYSLKVISDINGINPGALSLPDTSNAIDISGYITDLTGSVNTYTALADGYVSIRITGTAMRIAVTNGVESSSQRSSAGVVACYVPVVAGETVSVYAVGTGINNAIFRPCKGNV